MRQTIYNYSTLTDLEVVKGIPMGTSAAPKEIIFHILEKNSESVDILDIGFGNGGLGHLVKSTHETSH